MKKFLPVLQACPLFDGITPAEILSMLHCLDARLRPIEKKELLWAEGDNAGNIGLVLEGAVRIEQTDYFGNRSILGRAGPGELFGESFACAGLAALPLDVTAAEDGTVMMLDCGRILHTCKNTCAFHQQLIFNLMKGLALKNIQFHQKIGITSRFDTPIFRPARMSSWVSVPFSK